ncbi:glycosyl transferase [bacterium]|nr:glycosyl transferase [bacterium]
MQNQSSYSWQTGRFALPGRAAVLRRWQRSSVALPIITLFTAFALNLHAAKVPNGEPRALVSDFVIHANQVAYDVHAPKFAIIESADALPADTAFQIVAADSDQSVFEGKFGADTPNEDWFPGRHFYRADFSEFVKAGKYRIEFSADGDAHKSFPFAVGERAVAAEAIPAIIGFYHHQRANTPQELNADSHLLLFGSTNRVDLHGGWCDASGDISKYFSHLAYANFMSPQQTPLVVWSMENAVDTAGPLLDRIGARRGMEDEALYGADYVLRSLSPDGYFYMTIFSYFKKDPEERRVVGLLANSKTTSDYQCAYREGGGMGIAALARASQWNRSGEYSSAEYLAGAERAFAHLEKNNLKYCDDGKENIIDDYCALMGATELWIATGKDVYREAARKRAANLNGRMSEAGYFIADDADRPFWHGSDAGLPVIALARYLDKETDSTHRTAALNTIRRALDYNLRVSGAVSNPFGYARQSFKFRGAVRDGFFIPHENVSGWWWQGENARLGSLATAAIVGGRLVAPGNVAFGVRKDLATFAGNQLDWILGGNPYDICFMYGHGENNVPYMESMFGHGSGQGGISNGITGKDGSPDGSGIDFRFHANGNEWRWTEQWIPHTAWFLQAVTAMSLEK